MDRILLDTEGLKPLSDSQPESSISLQLLLNVVWISPFDIARILYPCHQSV